MDDNFASMRSLIQVFDQTLYNAIHQSGDFSHFYFCYRYAFGSIGDMYMSKV